MNTPVRTVFFQGLIVRWTPGGGGGSHACTTPSRCARSSMPPRHRTYRFPQYTPYSDQNAPSPQDDAVVSRGPALSSSPDPTQDLPVMMHNGGAEDRESPQTPPQRRISGDVITRGSRTIDPQERKVLHPLRPTTNRQPPTTKPH